MAKLISIIIPAYNVENYIERCLSSIICQNIDYDLVEVIVINDGSTDQTLDKCKEIKDRHPDLIHLIDKPNKGVSSARNQGLDLAIGEYIFFIDADDMLAPNSLSQLIIAVTTHYNTDIILFNTCHIDKNGKAKQIKSHLPKQSQLIRVEDYINQYTILSAVWQGLFSRHIFDKYSIRMPEGLIAEDDDFSVRYFSVANQMYYTNTSVYEYHTRPGSITNTTQHTEVSKLLDDRIVIFEQLANYVKSFKGKRLSGLNRKMDFLALDILRLLIRKSTDKDSVFRALSTLSDLGYFPLKKNSYTNRYIILRHIFLNRRRIDWYFSHAFFLNIIRQIV